MASSTALITGANRGIGLALAQRLGLQGPTIGTHRGPSPAALDGVAWAHLDVANPESVKALATEMGDAPISLLVCNAGVYLDKGNSLETGYDPALWAQTFAVNVTGVFLTVQALLPNLRAAPSAKVAIISSQMASHERAPGGSYIYRASKAAVLNVGRNLASDLSGDGIAVGIYHPGWVQTDMGGPEAALTPEQSARDILGLADGLGLAQSGSFLRHDGEALPW